MHTLSIIGKAVATMTSREIAELTRKDLSHIHRDIRTMLDELAGIDDPDLDHVREDKDARGYTTCFHLPKSLTITLMAGYSVKMRHAVVKRWQELEGEPSTPAALSTMDILQIAMESEKGRIAAVEQLAIAAPKADALDRIAGATGSITIREAAKDLQVKPLQFSNWLKENKWIFKQGRSNLAHQPRIDAGLMTHKVTLVEVEGEDGVTFEKPVTQARITPKGLAKLAVVFGEVAA